MTSIITKNGWVQFTSKKWRRIKLRLNLDTHHKSYLDLITQRSILHLPALIRNSTLVSMGTDGFPSADLEELQLLLATILATSTS